MKIKKLKIDKFRHLKNIEMEFGERITAIAGQNGTGKSSILGIIGHVFTFTKTDELKQMQTIFGKNFETVYSEIFKFSYPEYDKPKDHIYTIELDNNENIPVVSYDRVEKGESKDLRLRVRKSVIGGGKVLHPVIFLGLRRLFPLAQEEKIIHNSTLKLTKEEQILYQNFHNEVLFLNEEIDPDLIEMPNKTYYGVKTTTYDCIGSSAGQDNIGQIITALLSFRRLREVLKESYNGGILLVDELDATLYPAAQIKLIEKLSRWAQDLDLQIIFTTHSLEIITKIFDKNYKHISKIIYLANNNGQTKNFQNEADIKAITNDLLMQTSKKEVYPRTPVFCEDEVARLWLSNLLTPNLKSKVYFLNASFSGDELIHLATKKIKFFQESIFIIDGDKRGKIKKSNKCPRVCFLPDKISPEKVFYNYLKSLPLDAGFWDSGLGEYNYRICFRDLNNISEDRDKMGEWLKNQKNHLGKGYSKLLNHWKQSHLKEVNVFNKEFENILKKIEESK